MANGLTPRQIPTGLNILGLGLPQVGENLRVEQQNQLLDLQQQQAADARQQAETDFGRAGAALGLNAPDIGALALTARADPARASALLGQAAQQQSPFGQQTLEANQQAMEMAAAQEERAGILFDLKTQGAELANAKAFADLQAMGQQGSPEQTIPEQWFDMPPGTVASFPKDTMPFVDPYTERRTVAPIPGSKEHTVKQEAVQATERAMENLNIYLQLVDEAGMSGTEMVGPLAQTMDTLRGQIEADILVARNFGAPQRAELERVEAAIPNPTSFSFNLAGVTIGQNPWVAARMKDQIKTGIRTQRELMERVLNDMYRRAPYLTPNEAVLGPEGMQRLFER